MWYRFKPYVSVAQRRAQAQRQVTQLTKQGKKLSPVALPDRTIARTFWGKAWCQHLESYSDYANRLPRGRTYVRNGTVLDLQVTPGVIEALVQGSELYTIKIKIEALPKATWANLKTRCAGEIGTVIELLQGRLSNAVMAIITDRDGGLFPSPRQINMTCSCPDIAGLCKHLAAVLYGVGARLDTQPDMLFKLRQVDHLEMIPTAGTVEALTRVKSSSRKTLQTDELADVFGVEIDRGGGEAMAPSSSPTQAGVITGSSPEAADRSPQSSRLKSERPAKGKLHSTPVPVKRAIKAKSKAKIKAKVTATSAAKAKASVKTSRQPAQRAQGSKGGKVRPTVAATKPPKKPTPPTTPM